MTRGWMTRRTAPVVVAMAGVALASCGGGGGSAPQVTVPSGVRAATPSATADLRADNMAVFAAPLARAVLTGGAGALLDPTGAGGARPSAAAASARRAGGATTPAVTAWRLAWRHARPDLRRHALAQSTEQLSCGVSGSLSVTVDDADNDGELSAGDGIVIVALACIDDPALPAVDGAFSMHVNAVEVDGSGEPTALDVSASFQDFEVGGYGRMNGAFRLWVAPATAASTRVRVSYLATTVAETTGSVVYDFDADDLSNALSGSFEVGGGIQIGGATYAIASTSRLTHAIDQPPSGGELRLTDAAGDSLRLLPRSATSFDLAFWPAGATAPAATLTGLSWDDVAD